MTATTTLRQRQTIAADPTASVWVAASAGTGKTHVLTNRVLRLLLAGSPPERILCLTFTKAAAAEMANRINEKLGAWTAMDDAALAQDLHALTGRPPEIQDFDQARRLFAQVLETPGGLKVQTIHAFSESLLARFPLEAALPPHFQVMDERTADEMLTLARDAVLVDDMRAEKPIASEITALVDDEGYARLMKTLSVERGRIYRLLHVAGGIDGLIQRIRDGLGVAAAETVDDVLAAAAKDVTIDVSALQRVAAAMLEGGKTDREHGRDIADWLGEPVRRVDRFDAYRRAFFAASTGRPYARLIHKQALQACPDGADILGAEAARLEAVEARRRAVEIAVATEALVRLGAALVDTYERFKRARALLDYDDLILKARDLLQQPDIAPWVLYKLDGGLDHILVDEAQDTNPEQWQIIQSLAEEFFTGEGAREIERTVFAVGDPKQSIFSFQRADPGAFEAMQDYFEARVTAAEGTWRPIELALSFRSTPSVLQVIDQIFADPDARQGLLLRQGEVRHFSERRGDAGLVELWPPETPVETAARAPWEPPIRQEPDDSPVGRLTDRIAGRIAAWLRDGELLAAAGRPIRAGDIMILVQRRRPFLEEMVRRLKQREIPVAGADRMLLGEQMAVMDLIALGRFLLLPDDDLTLAVVLKGPLIGFEEGTLFRLAHDRDPERSLWATLRQRRTEDPAFDRAVEHLGAWLRRVDFLAPFDFYHGLLTADGGRRMLLARLGNEANDAIDEFLDLALEYERTHPPSLQGFLAWIDSGEVEIKRDLEQGRDEVRVLTTHGAKGLQAPIVFLADTVRVPQQVPDILWQEKDGEATSLYWLPRRDLEETTTRMLREAAVRRRDEEYRRLFYVALTRAADRLYITGWEGARGRAANCWYELARRAMDKIAEPIELPDGAHVLSVSNPQLPPTPQPTSPDARDRAHSLPAWHDRPAPLEPEPARPLAPSRPEWEEPSVRHPIGDDRGNRFQRGLLLHRLLQSLPDLRAVDRQGAASRYLERAASDLNPEARLAIANEALAVLKAPDFALFFQPGSRAEAPIVGIVGERIISGQVDRLVVTAHEIVVIDYKSNRPAPENQDDCPPAYLAQMAAYRALLREIYPEHRVRSALLWTEAPRLMALDDKLLDRYAP